MPKIFVLEDDKDLLNLYSRALSFKGFKVITATTAEQAIEILQDGSNVPDIAVLDMMLPGQPGSTVVEFIRHQAEFKGLPIIVVSCDDAYRHRLTSYGVTFMAKPIDLNDLYIAVAELAP